MDLMFNEGDFIKKATSIYLVKDFKKEGNRYLLDYYFKSTKSPSGILHSNGSRKFYSMLIDSIKLATMDDIKILKDKIRAEYPKFTLKEDLSNLSSHSNDTLTEYECIEFLKERGYLVYKQL